ncbi:hypothetical protein ACG1VR_11300 [Cedecea davisae]|uniref:hypothetical protein n=1 Tax=Cedecea davisae TaxID=158484 RepID=UPI00376F2896
MQIVNLTRALFCNSGKAAYRLVLGNPRFSRFATFVISIKNENAQFKLANANLSSKEKILLKNKVATYSKHLENINFLNATGR